jgi:hypothetical protein
MQQSSSSEANSSLFRQETYHTLCSPIPVLSFAMNPVEELHTYFVKIHVSVIPPSIPRSYFHLPPSGISNTSLYSSSRWCVLHALIDPSNLKTNFFPKSPSSFIYAKWRATLHLGVLYVLYLSKQKYLFTVWEKQILHIWFSGLWRRVVWQTYTYKSIWCHTL